MLRLLCSAPTLTPILYGLREEAEEGWKGYKVKRGKGRG